jgi:hypothetical protein
VNHREDLLYRASRALQTSAMCEEAQEAADSAAGTPSYAARLHWDAAGLLRDLAERLTRLADAHTWDARRMERAAKAEEMTGIEYRKEPA